MNEIVITANEAGQRLDKFLKKYLTDMPLSGIYKVIRKKMVTVNGKKSGEKYVLNNGDILKFFINITDIQREAKEDFIQIDYDFKTVHEDANILIVEKKYGVLVHPDEGKEPTLTDEVLSYLYDKGEYSPREEKTFSPAPCNRLDRNTIGLVIFAKNYDALKAINEAIREGNIKKYYLTIVKGRIDDGEYTAHMTKDLKTKMVKIHEEKVDGSKEIITVVKTVDTIGQFSFLEIELLTGRSHQIRAHLASLGNPIVGDPKYGSKKVNTFICEQYGIKSQMLVAYKLAFENCPEAISYLNGKTIAIPMPNVFKKIKNDLFRL